MGAYIVALLYTCPHMCMHAHQVLKTTRIGWYEWYCAILAEIDVSTQCVGMGCSPVPCITTWYCSCVVIYINITDFLICLDFPDDNDVALAFVVVIRFLMSLLINN